MKNFLSFIRPEGLLNLVAIAPSGGGITGKTFSMSLELDDACHWALHQNSTIGHNVYFTVNPLRHPVEGKPLKDDIACVELLHCDIDPDAFEYCPGTEEQWNSEDLNTESAYHRY